MEPTPWKKWEKSQKQELAWIKKRVKLVASARGSFKTSSIEADKNVSVCAMHAEIFYACFWSINNSLTIY